MTIRATGKERGTYYDTSVKGVLLLAIELKYSGNIALSKCCKPPNVPLAPNYSDIQSLSDYLPWYLDSYLSRGVYWVALDLRYLPSR